MNKQNPSISSLFSDMRLSAFLKTGIISSVFNNPLNILVNKIIKRIERNAD